MRAMPATPLDVTAPASRNAPCPCGSDKRYKECHGRLGDERGQPAAADGARAPSAANGAMSPPRSVALASREAETLNHRGTLLQGQRRYDEALACFDAALALAPDHPGILGNRGNALLDLRRHEEAARCFARIVELAPDHPWALGSLYQAQMRCCDWTSIDALAARIDAAVRHDRVAVTPFVHLTLSDSPADQLRSARVEAGVHAVTALPPFPRGSRRGGGKIRIAYLSGNFRQHPSSTLSAHLFETHDRTRFEVTGISFGPDTGDPLRRRLERAFDHFIDMRKRGDAEIAALIRERGIDIAIDLMGYTNGARPGVLLRRAAPVQVGYLGYPGTSGGAALDYLLADAHAIPRGQDAHYAERVVRLPDSCLPHDPTQAIGASPTRADAGLPADAFVFCCFNQPYKITPATFDVWMRLLARVEGAVLWLLEPSDVAQRNLQREAAARGVDPPRLVFASLVAPDVHLARHRLADLFLDTHPYNAHAPAVEALWAGLPVLTFPGSTMAGRVATGLLHAVGLPELVARDRADYEARALALARAPHALRELREKLARHRETVPLFDATRYRAAIEAAYATMAARSAAGLPPAPFDVAPGDRAAQRP